MGTAINGPRLSPETRHGRSPSAPSIAPRGSQLGRARLTPSCAYSLLAHACMAVGLDSTNAKLIRLGSNGILLPELGSRGRSYCPRRRITSPLRREVAIARWLAKESVTAAHLLPTRFDQ